MSDLGCRKGLLAPCGGWSGGNNREAGQKVRTWWRPQGDPLWSRPAKPSRAVREQGCRALQRNPFFKPQLCRWVGVSSCGATMSSGRCHPCPAGWGSHDTLCTAVNLGQESRWDLFVKGYLSHPLCIRYFEDLLITLSLNKQWLSTYMCRVLFEAGKKVLPPEAHSYIVGSVENAVESKVKETNHQ